MCDHGRLNTFQPINAENRIKAPLVRKDGALMEVGWDEAIAAIAFRLKMLKKNEIGAIGSAFASNEDGYLFVKLMHLLGVNKIDVLPHVLPGDEDDLLIRADKTPNGLGMQLVGMHLASASDLQTLAHNINSGTIKALYVLDDDIASNPHIAKVLSKLDFLVVHASKENGTTMEADVVLSCSTYAEQHGTFTNFQGRVQRIRPAVATAELDRALDGFAMSRLDKFGAHNDRWMKGVRRDARPTWRILTNVANALGAKWKYSSAEEVFDEIASQIEAFTGMSYMRIGNRGMMPKTKTKTEAAAFVRH
jgi:NADH-quinone oxidoreductase subunit G